MASETSKEPKPIREVTIRVVMDVYESDPPEGAWGGSIDSFVTELQLSPEAATDTNTDTFLYHMAERDRKNMVRAIEKAVSDRAREILQYQQAQNRAQADDYGGVS